METLMANGKSTQETVVEQTRSKAPDSDVSAEELQETLRKMVRDNFVTESVMLNPKNEAEGPKEGPKRVSHCPHHLETVKGTK